MIALFFELFIHTRKCQHYHNAHRHLLGCNAPISDFSVQLMHRNDLQFIKPVCRGRAYRRAFELPIINPKEINALSVDLEVQFLAYRSNFNIGDTSDCSFFSFVCKTEECR